MSFRLLRTQQVKVNSNVSDKREIKVGIPQGLVIGPFIFFIFINDFY